MAGAGHVIARREPTGTDVPTDPGVTKGAVTDVAAISARLDVAWDATSGAFVMPLGASDGTRGWLANTPKLAKYGSKTVGVTPWRHREGHHCEGGKATTRGSIACDAPSTATSARGGTPV